MKRTGAAALVVLVAVVASLLTSPVAMSATNEGQLDLSFGSCGFSTVTPKAPSTGDEDPAWSTDKAVAVQPDGKIVLAGDRGVARRLPDGTPDYAFGIDSLAYAPTVAADVSVSDVAVQAGGSIIVGGLKSDYLTGANGAFYFVRYLPSGAIDTSFGSGGMALLPGTSSVTAMAVQADGKIVAGTWRKLVRLLPSGAIDPDFGINGVATIPGGYAVDVAVQPDGRLLVAVESDQPESAAHDFGVLRLLGTGLPDPTFGSGQLVVVDVASDTTTDVAVGGDGRIVVAGMTMVAGEGWNRTTLIRLLADGSRDTGFGNNGVVTSGETARYQGLVRELVITPDGRPVIAADVDGAENQVHAVVARFTVAGALDTTFGTDGTTDVLGSQYGPATGGLARTPDAGFVIVSRVNEGTVARLRGTTAVAGELVTAANCAKRITVSPRSLDLSIPEGRGTPRIYVVTNTGTSAVRIGRLAWVNQGTLVVIGDTCTPAALMPRSSCQVVITADPSRAASSAPGFLSIWHDGERGWNGSYVAAPDIRTLPADGMGWNGLGQVGAGPAEGSNAPVYAGLPDAVSVAAGWFHTLAVRKDGTVWAWGWNGVGQLGDGTTTDRHTPVQVAGLTDIATVAAGAHSSFAITRSGTVYAWGWNPTGQLGDGTAVDRHRPVRLSTLPPMAQISGGAYHTLAVSADHRAWSWGWNGLGALGDGTTTDQLVPRPIPGLDGVKQVAAGMLHSLSLSLLGSVSAWGWNGVGQLGDGTTTDHSRPAAVQGLDTGNLVSYIAAGAHHSLAVKSEDVVAWGWNASGQLGDGTTVDRPVPVRVTVPRGVQRVTRVAGGVFHSFATVADGTVWGWGSNAWGQLGAGTTQATSALPLQIRAFQAPIVLSGGYAHSVAG